MFGVDWEEGGMVYHDYRAELHAAPAYHAV
jgi:hypothetical protein